MKKSANDARISSPAATGGAGNVFEQHVSAYWLAHLLVGAIPPILRDSTVIEVHFQTEHLGWQTDDFLIVCETASGNRRKLAGQVKRSFTVSAVDPECKKAIEDFWKDFKSAERFSAGTDRLVLVIRRGTNVLLEDFGGLLDCARAVRDDLEFEHRLATPGFITAKAVHYGDEIRKIVEELEGRNLTTAELWSFLRVLHVLSLDLNTSTGNAESMVKTLLAHTTNGSNPTAAAEDSWNALLATAGEAMGEAKAFRREDLPAQLRERHSPLGGPEQAALKALGDHTAIILGGIHSTIGESLHLRRARLVQKVLAHVESSQVVLVSGPAGSGKSAIAKDVIDLLSADYFTFSFRAEEFAVPHFDQTLHGAQIPANARSLGAILATQSRKILLIESVERLLEKSTRDAFTDLLTMAAGDQGWRILLTCRDYSTDLVRVAFLAGARLNHAVITLPGLDDEELAEVQTAYPALVRPLTNPALRRVLRNPYFLDKSLQISWSDERALPETERELRTQFWQQIVRADHRLGDGMPQRREQMFEEISIRRARGMTMYVPSDDLDWRAVEALRFDSLVVSSDNTNSFISPAHDVLEDWAILHWIDKQWARANGVFKEFSAALGPHPAIRRSYRKWVGELIDRDLQAADRLFESIVTDSGLPDHFRDDTLVACLRAPSSPALLERQVDRLLTKDRYLLKRIIYLLRVACVTTPDWLLPGSSHGSLLNVPDGPAWAWVLRLVEAHVDEFAEGEQSLLLGFIEDWSRAVTWWSPYPDGAPSVAAIAYWLLPRFDTYRSEVPRKRTLEIIAKIPKADAEQFAALLGRSDDEEERDRVTDDLEEIVFAGTAGFPAARDLPDVVISAATEYLLCSESDLRRKPYADLSLELETVFGLKDGLRHDFFPESAYRGPFLGLLRNHPRKGLRFVLRVFNQSADWYAHPRVTSMVEPPSEMELIFPDGSSRKQWANGRLWNWYRGTSVGPYVLQSILMAVERWLFELAEVRPQDLDGGLLSILRDSDSAALTAVVASVTTAFPHRSGETLLVLLRSPACIRLDRERMVAESQAPSTFSGKLLPGRPENKVYELERKEADRKPQRARDLESAIANLQLGPFAARVHAILDEMRAAMPPVSEQNDEHRAWRLAMHRMDLRQYTAAQEEQTPESEEATPSAPEAQYIRLNPNEPDPDVKEMMQRTTTQYGEFTTRMSLLMWGLKVFGHEENPAHDPSRWHERLKEAMSPESLPRADDRLYGTAGGPGVVAAVCVRDHWEEMSAEEKNWCVSRVCSEVLSQADVWDYRLRLQVFSMSADRPCASVVPLLLAKELSSQQREQVQGAFIIAVTHPVNEVRSYASAGVATHLWPIDRALTFRVVNALATEAKLVDQARRKEEKRSYDKRRTIDELGREAASAVRKKFWKPDSIPWDAYEGLDISEWFGAEANTHILTIFAQAPIEPAAVSAFVQTAKALVTAWDTDRGNRRGDQRRQRHHDAESAHSRLLQDFLLRTSRDGAALVAQPILNAIDRHADKVHWIIQGLITAEDARPNTAQFWFVWQLFAERIRKATWLSEVDDEYGTGGAVLSAIFLGAHWKENVRHWKSVEGYAHLIHGLFEQLKPSASAMHDYVRFLYLIGDQSLPEAFVRVAKCLKAGDAPNLLKRTNTVFMLEVLLQRYVYGKPLELKSDPRVRSETLFLLDTLVENGSSAAFRMRDDFVTPVSAT